MSEQVLNASVTEYKSNIYMMLGQSEARFRNAVTEDKYYGEAGVPVEQFGTVDGAQAWALFPEMVRIEQSLMDEGEDDDVR